MRCSRSAIIAIIAILAGLVLWNVYQPTTAELAAQEKKKPTKKASAKDPVKEWTRLDARQKTVVTQLSKLVADYRVAKTAAVRQKIKNEHSGLVAKLLKEIHPAMAKVGAELLKKQPVRKDVAEFMLEHYFERNQYASATKLAERMLKAGHKSAVVYNVGGVSYYALHNFARAKELLSTAQRANLLDQRGGRRLPVCDEYAVLWKKEQAIRKREGAAKGEKALPLVAFNTTKGRIEIELFEDDTPNTVANFVNLIENKKYDGVAFHRVLPNFMAQGGDTGADYTIACECYTKNYRRHFAGSLSMAHIGRRDTAGSQFFMTHLPTDHLNGKHTVFGRVVKGLDTVRAIEVGDRIKKAVVLRKRNHKYVPKTGPGL